jgi:aspartate/methionine/tyrosine aminotransferase
VEFRPIAYLDWEREHAANPRIRFNLASSGAPVRDPATLPALDPAAATASPTARLAAYYEIPEETFIPVSGTSGAIFTICATLLSPGDVVIVETPTYEPLRAVPEALGARLVRLPRRFEDGFAPDWALLEALVARERPRLVILSDHHNPSGAVLASEGLVRLARLAHAADVRVLLDTVYLDFCDGNVRCPARLSPRFLVASSLTKTYGLGSLRFGWIATMDHAVGMRIRRALVHMASEPARPSEESAARALAAGERLREEARALARESMPLLARWAAETPGVSCVPSAGTLFAFPRLPAGTDARALVQLLEEEYETLVTPGDFFEAPGYLRIGVGRGPKVVREGLARIAEALVHAQAKGGTQ